MASLIIGGILLLCSAGAYFLFRSIGNQKGRQAGVYRTKNEYDHNRAAEILEGEASTARTISKVGIGGMVLSTVIMLSSAWVKVETGHTSVPTLFGKVVETTPYTEGLHFPVNPLYDWTHYDLRQKTAKFDKIGVPSKDQLTSTFDLSIQYRLIGARAAEMKKNTGNAKAVIQVHMVPYFRSLVREQGKTVSNAEEFYLESVQQQMQADLRENLRAKVGPMGIEVDDVLIRNVQLPPFIAKAVEDKKKREQESEKQKAELKRFTTEQEQKVATAKAEFDAAKLEEQKIRLLADAEAYKIKKMNEQLAKSPMYVKLKQVEAWDGTLPKYAGGDNIPMIDLRNTQ